MTYLKHLIRKFKGRGLVIDTNLIILLLIGSYDRSLIGKSKLVSAFTEEDFDCMVQFGQNFELVITQTILTEVCNITDSFNRGSEQAFFQLIGKFISQHEEEYTPSQTICEKHSFLHFGIADSTIDELSLNGRLVMTDDLKLYGYIVSQYRDAINFNHIRTEYLL